MLWLLHFMMPSVAVHCSPLQNGIDRQLPLYRPRHQVYVLLSSSVLLTHVPAVLRQIELSLSQYKTQIKILQPRCLLQLTPELHTSYVGRQSVRFQWNVVWASVVGICLFATINNRLHLLYRCNTVCTPFVYSVVGCTCTSNTRCRCSIWVWNLVWHCEIRA